MQPRIRLYRLLRGVSLTLATITAPALASGLPAAAHAADGVTATKAATTVSPSKTQVSKTPILDSLRLQPKPATTAPRAEPAKTSIYDSLALKPRPAATAPRAEPAKTSIYDSLALKPKPATTTTTPESQVRLSPLVRPKAIDAHSIEVPLDLVGVAAEHTRVLSRQGQGWQSGPDAFRVVNGQRAVTVPAGGSIVVAPTPDQGIITRLLSRSGTTFPGAIIQARTTATGGTQVELLSLSVEPITWPMSWDAAVRKYVTQLRVLLKLNQRQVSPNQDVRVRFSARYATVQPPDVTLRANEPIKDHFVTVMAPRHDPTPIVTAESDLGRVQNELSVDIGAPKLKVHTVARELNGFGLESTMLVVTSVADDDIDLVQPVPMRVSLSTDRGTLEQPEVIIPVGQSRSHVPLRSAGIGVAHISAVGAFGTTNLEVNFGFPTVFLFLVLAGGTVGGALHWIRRAVRARASLGMLLLEGVLVGPVLVIALLAGASFAGLAANQLIASDAGRFTMAVVFGFIGTPAVDALRRYAFTTPDDQGGGADSPGAGEASKKRGSGTGGDARRSSRRKTKGPV